MVNIGRQTITLAALTLGAAILAAPIGPIGPAPAAAAPVTWSFFETACTDLQRGSDCTPPQPFVLATLVLPGPTSAGSAFWQGDPRVAPVYTGDSFAFTVPSALPSIQPLTPAFTGSSQCSGGHDICDFDISWSETAGQLTAVQITFDSFDDSIDLGLTRGQTASDNVLGGCVTSQCAVAGFWQSDLLLPEPGSAALLASGLFGAWLGRRRRTGRVSVANL